MVLVVPKQTDSSVRMLQGLGSIGILLGREVSGRQECERGMLVSGAMSAALWSNVSSSCEQYELRLSFTLADCWIKHLLFLVTYISSRGINIDSTRLLRQF